MPFNKKKPLPYLVKVFKKDIKDLYRFSKGLANNVKVANEAESDSLCNDDFVVKATPL